MARRDHVQSLRRQLMRCLFLRSAICAAILLTVCLSSTLCAGTPAGTVISAGAVAAYLDGDRLCQAASEPAVVTVAPTAGVALAVGSAPMTIVLGRSYYIRIDVTNTGNQEDVIALRAASAQGWNVAMIRDDNGDGIHQPGEMTTITDTGVLAPDSTRRCFLMVTVPFGANAGDTIAITATSSSDPSTQTEAAIQLPIPVAHKISFTQSPQVSPSTVDSGGVAQCSATAVDSLDDEVTYMWSDGGAGGTFIPNASCQNPVYTAPVNSSGADIAVTLTCTATCSLGLKISQGATPVLVVRKAPAVEFSPKQVWAPVGFVFQTPPVILNDPGALSSVSFTIGIPVGISLDAKVVDKSLACIRNGSGVDRLEVNWNPDSRTISVRAYIASPAATVEIIKSISLIVANGVPETALTIDGRPALCITPFKPAPGDFNRDRQINDLDIALFGQQWQKWHRLPPPVFNPAVDAVFDLGPRNPGIWPEWTPIGDGRINILDATAFVECWMGSQNKIPVYLGPVQTVRTFSLMQVTVPSAPYGVFQAAIQLPSSAGFDPAIDGSGNLRYVFKGIGVGNLFFSEFDPATRTLWLTGNVTGSPPFHVASIFLLP